MKLRVPRIPPAAIVAAILLLAALPATAVTSTPTATPTLTPTPTWTAPPGCSYEAVGLALNQQIYGAGPTYPPETVLFCPEPLDDGAGLFAVMVCLGGDNATQPCTVDEECPDSTCGGYFAAVNYQGFDTSVLNPALGTTRAWYVVPPPYQTQQNWTGPNRLGGDWWDFGDHCRSVLADYTAAELSGALSTSGLCGAACNLSTWGLSVGPDGPARYLELDDAAAHVNLSGLTKLRISITTDSAPPAPSSGLSVLYAQPNMVDTPTNIYLLVEQCPATPTPTETPTPTVTPTGPPAQTPTRTPNNTLAVRGAPLRAACLFLIATSPAFIAADFCTLLGLELREVRVPGTNATPLGLGDVTTVTSIKAHNGAGTLLGLRREGIDFTSTRYDVTPIGDHSGELWVIDYRP